MKPMGLTCISVLAMAPGFIVAAQMSAPAPPLHRVSTVMLHERVESLVVDGDFTWFVRESDVIAYDLKSSHELWKHKLDGGRHAEDIAVDAGTVFISTDPNVDETNAVVFALESRTGKLKWSLPRTGHSSAIGTGDGVIYTQLAHSTSRPSTRVVGKPGGPRN